MRSGRFHIPVAAGTDVLALGGRTLVAAAGEELVVVDLDEHELQTRRAPFAVTELAVSPSGRYVAAMERRYSRRHAAVIDLHSGQTELVTPAGCRYLTAAAFVRQAAGERLLVAGHGVGLHRVLELRDPSGRETHGTNGTRRVLVDQIAQIGPGHAAAIAHGEGEGADALITFRLSEVEQDFARESDRASRLNAGPGPGAAYVAFRDHDDAEDEDHAENPLWAFVGLYLRRYDTGELLQRIPWNGPIRRDDRLFATDDWIALAMGPSAQIVSRHGADPVVLAGVATAVDTFGVRLAVVTAEGEVTVFDFTSP